MNRTLRLLGPGLLSLACCFTAIAQQPTDPVVPHGRIDLFNGKDLSGWSFASRSNTPPSQTWTVTNGVIHCTGQPYGYARAAGRYCDYRLTVEWRFVKVAPKADNSGIFVQVQSPDQVWPKCIECQGQHQHQGDFILMGGATCKGHEAAGSRVVAMAGPSNEKAPGEWNTYEITCSGGSVRAAVNGKLMNEVSNCSVSAGGIAIQSEGGELEIKRLSLEPL
jgi:hypothetical protein